MPDLESLNISSAPDLRGQRGANFWHVLVELLFPAFLQPLVRVSKLKITIGCTPLPRELKKYILSTRRVTSCNM